MHPPVSPSLAMLLFSQHALQPTIPSSEPIIRIAGHKFCVALSGMSRDAEQRRQRERDNRGPQSVAFPSRMFPGSHGMRKGYAIGPGQFLQSRISFDYATLYR
jgi:hypothetical protein